MTNLEKLRAAIIEAVPEILDLQVGCQLRERADGLKTYIGRVKYDGTAEVINFTYWQRREDIEDEYEILGRPITLADVLRAINQHDIILVSDAGFFYCSMGDELKEIDDARWNLAKDNLDDQSPECIDFLTSVLCK